jgi:hypothetical protein
MTSDALERGRGPEAPGPSCGRPPRLIDVVKTCKNKNASCRRRCGVERRGVIRRHHRRSGHVVSGKAVDRYVGSPTNGERRWRVRSRARRKGYRVGSG